MARSLSQPCRLTNIACTLWLLSPNDPTSFTDLYLTLVDSNVRTPRGLRDALEARSLQAKPAQFVESLCQVEHEFSSFISLYMLTLPEPPISELRLMQYVPSCNLDLPRPAFSDLNILLECSRPCRIVASSRLHTTSMNSCARCSTSGLCGRRRSFERLSGTPLFRIPHEQSIEVLQQLYVLHCEPDRQEATGMSDREALLGELYSLPAVRALGILANTPRQAAE